MQARWWRLRRRSVPFTVVDPPWHQDDKAGASQAPDLPPWVPRWLRQLRGLGLVGHQVLIDAVYLVVRRDFDLAFEAASS